MAPIFLLIPYTPHRYFRPTIRAEPAHHQQRQITRQGNEHHSRISLPHTRLRQPNSSTIMHPTTLLHSVRHSFTPIITHTLLLSYLRTYTFVNVFVVRLVRRPYVSRRRRSRAIYNHNSVRLRSHNQRSCSQLQPHQTQTQAPIPIHYQPTPIRMIILPLLVARSVITPRCPLLNLLATSLSLPPTWRLTRAVDRSVVTGCGRVCNIAAHSRTSNRTTRSLKVMMVVIVIVTVMRSAHLRRDRTSQPRPCSHPSPHPWSFTNHR